MNILIPIISGSEVRQFFFSGIVNELLKENEVFTILKNNDSKIKKKINEYSPEIQILPYPKPYNKKSLLSYVRFILDFHHDSISNRWKYSSDKKKFVLKDFFLKTISLILKIKIICNFLLKFERKLFFFQNDKDYLSLLKKNKIDLIVLNVTRILINPKLLISALQLKIPVKVLYHSNKEVDAQIRISYPYFQIGVWNNRMKKKLVEKFNIDPMKIFVTGCSHFSYLKVSQKIEKSEFDKLFKIDSENQFVVFYSSAGLIIENEFLIIDLLKKNLMKISSNFKIIIRKNPMDNTNSLEKKFLNDKNIFINVPKWEFDYINGINYANYEDLIEYRSILYYSNICVNIPSTVSLDCAILKKPVINLCFDIDNMNVLNNNKKIIGFWNAPFYKSFHNMDFIFPSFNEKELSDNLYLLFNNSSKFDDYEKLIKKILSYQPSNMNSKSVNFILN